MADLTTRDWSYDDDRAYGSWWNSQAGFIVRWTLFFVFVTIILTYLIGGYFHAKARIKKGLPPLAYHRCLVSRRYYMQQNPENQWPQQNGYYYPPQQGGYYMNDMPLPAYDPNRPPVYSGPPEGASKVDPSQNGGSTQRMPEGNLAPEYAPPPGPPPAVTR